MHDEVRGKVMSLKKTLADLAEEVRSSNTIMEIDPDDLAELQEQGSNPAIIDVREPDEYAKGHIPSSYNIPRGIIEMKIEKILFNNNASPADLARPLVLYCGGGHRSILTAESLRLCGFQTLYSLEGGFSAYKDANYTIET